MLDELNPEQLAAAQHGDGPLLIVAGAGTGKTATLVHRVAHLIGRGADPRRILLLTFTRRAAAEMLRRVEAVRAATGDGRGGASERVWGGTFHAIAARLLRIHARDIGMEPDFTILDRGDAKISCTSPAQPWASAAAASASRRSPRASMSTPAASTPSCR